MSDETALVVDDSASMRKLLSFILAKEGWDVVEASTGRDALDLFSDAEPSLVFLDAELPDMAGADVLHAMRRSTTGRPARVVVATGREEADAPQGDSYLKKPFTRADVVAAMGEVMST